MTTQQPVGFLSDDVLVPVSVADPLPISNEDMLTYLTRILDTLERIQEQLALITGINLEGQERMHDA